MGGRALACGLAWLLPMGCGAAVFACEGDGQCVGADGTGVCEPSGYCSFPDEDCPSGRRYGDAAPGTIAGTCVPAGEETEDGTSESASSSAGTTTITTDGPSTAPGEASSSASASTTMPVVDDSGTSVDPQTTSSTSEPPPTTGTSGVGSTTSTGPFTVEYTATIAVCTQVGVHDPEACAVQTGADQFTVDTSDGSGVATHGWLRFDLDDAIEGSDVLSVQIVLRVGPDKDDASGQSSEVWSVDAFDLDALSTGDPAAIELLAADLGPVAVDTDVIFDLPTDTVAPGEPVHLGLFPIATDGVDYRGHTSATPPRLLIEVQP